MHFGRILASFFCFTTWIHLVHAFIGPGKGCDCLRASNTQVNISRIKSYSIQEETICSVRVIKFLTFSGKTICSDPNNLWTKNTMKKLDLQKRAMRSQHLHLECLQLKP
ncbi:hypothetical protein OJAV_G00173620 [Oryzias javanicus]|uniref:Chemokine interleukin-8-like domain-containing protein n=1 Tax=Oryzias javanicus TaxID=123683 RepID=A0A3S2NXQ5_ORYJA|nr:hypothetical protein OJAV_G00173620 [Oryzias javanicus]